MPDPFDHDWLPKPIPPEAWERYYSDLGRFAHAWGQCEEALNAGVHNFVNDRLGLGHQDRSHSFLISALMGGQRIGPLRDTIKRLMRVTRTPPEIVAEVNRVLDHLGEIHLFRDRLMHHGAIRDDTREDGWLTSNDITVREWDQGETLHFTPQMLLDMADDLDRIPDMIFDRLIDPDRGYFGSPEELARHMAALGEPWRYKPSELVRRGPKHAPNPRSRGARLPPSRE